MAVWICAGGQEQLDDVGVAPVGSQRQGGESVVAGGGGVQVARVGRKHAPELVEVAGVEGREKWSFRHASECTLEQRVPAPPDESCTRWTIIAR